MGARELSEYYSNGAMSTPTNKILVATPLSVAARNGYEEIVKMLLGRDEVNADQPDMFDRTPLWGAARAGQGGVVKILLGQGSVRPDKPDNACQTPL